MHRKYLQRAVFLPVWLLIAANPCGAQDEATIATARQLGVEGIDAFQSNDYPTAEQKLERAYRLVARPQMSPPSATLE